MNYELIKKLREAGYPLKRSLETGKVLKADMLFIEPDGSVWYYPTLSELIEACGDDFLQLGRRKGFATGEWGAYAPRSIRFEDLPEGLYRYGSTLEEAVARLWLALNKK